MNCLTKKQEQILNKVNLEDLAEDKGNICSLWYPIEHEICWYLRDGMGHFQLMRDAFEMNDNSLSGFIQKWGIEFTNKKYNGFITTLGKIKKNSDCFIPVTRGYLQKGNVNLDRRALFDRDYLNYMRSPEIISFSDARELTDRIWEESDFKDKGVICHGIDFGRAIIDYSTKQIIRNIKEGDLDTEYERELSIVLKKLVNDYRTIANLE